MLLGSPGTWLTPTTILRAFNEIQYLALSHSPAAEDVQCSRAVVAVAVAGEICSS